MAKARIRGGIETHRIRLDEERRAEAAANELEQQFDEARVTSLRNWFNDEVDGPDRVRRVATALGQKGTVIFKTLKDVSRANKAADTTQKIETFAIANGYSPNSSMGGD